MTTYDKIGIGISSPEFSLSLEGNSSNISLGNNVFINGQGSTGRITNNAFFDSGWEIYDSASHASTIELRDSGIIEMYGTTTAGSTSWTKMFGFDAPRNKVYFPSGNVGIGTTSPTEKLTVAGTAKAEEIIVEENVGADFVFADAYNLPSLTQVEQHIKSKKHLPEIPSAKEMIANGVKVGELQMKLLQKIEEMTLYVIELEKMLIRQQDEIEKLSVHN